MFIDPSPTPADLRFRILGIPVRIHPFFWIVALLLGPKAPQLAALWVLAVLVSVVVHEMGHALLQRAYGAQPQIVLYSFGGLAIGSGGRLTPLRQILISLAGPFAGFALAAMVWGVALAMGSATNNAVISLIEFLLFINIVWGLLNLLPIYPLDGGQVARELFTMFLRPDRGIVFSLWVSILTAALIAAYFLQSRSLFATVMFGLLAFNNYQALEAYQRSRGQGW